jgi:diguanylate cyclase (GGDEF)-like protein
MNQTFFVILLIILVTVNVILIGAAVLRSFFRRRHQRLDGPRAGSVTRPSTANRGVLAAPMTDGQSQTTRTDAVTGLLMPGEWNRIVADEDARCHRYGRPATVVIIELEGLDRLVGILGRDAGDRILPAVADAMSRNARGADHLARLGPSRFGILLPETGEVEAVNYVERVRQACDMWLESGAIALRLSIGWASPMADRSLSDAMTLAYERMFAELRRNARRANDLEIARDVEGSPSPA